MPRTISVRSILLLLAGFLADASAQTTALDLPTLTSASPGAVGNNGSVGLSTSLSQGYVDVLLTTDPLASKTTACEVGGAVECKGDTLSASAKYLIAPPVGGAYYVFGRVRSGARGQAAVSAWSGWGDKSLLPIVKAAWDTATQSYAVWNLPIHTYTFGRYGEVLEFVVDKTKDYELSFGPKPTVNTPAPSALFTIPISYGSDQFLQSVAGNKAYLTLRSLSDSLALVRVFLVPQPADVWISSTDKRSFVAKVYPQPVGGAAVDNADKGYRETVVMRRSDPYREAMISAILYAAHRPAVGDALFSTTAQTFTADSSLQVDAVRVRSLMLQQGLDPSRYTEWTSAIAKQWSSGRELGRVASGAERLDTLLSYLGELSPAAPVKMAWKEPRGLLLAEGIAVHVDWEIWNRSLQDFLEPGILVHVNARQVEAGTGTPRGGIVLRSVLKASDTLKAFDLSNATALTNLKALLENGSQLKLDDGKKSVVSIELLPRFFQTSSPIFFDGPNETRSDNDISNADENPLGSELVAGQVYRSSFFLRPGQEKYYKLKKNPTGLLGVFGLATGERTFESHTWKVKVGEDWTPETPLQVPDSGAASCEDYLRADVVEYDSKDYALHLLAVAAMPDTLACQADVEQFADGKSLGKVERSALVSYVGLNTASGQYSVQSAVSNSEIPDTAKDFQYGLHAALKNSGEVRVFLSNPISTVKSNDGGKTHFEAEQLASALPQEGSLLKTYQLGTWSLDGSLTPERMSQLWSRFLFQSKYAGTATLQFQYYFPYGYERKEPDLSETVLLKSYLLDWRTDVNNDGTAGTDQDEALEGKAPGMIILSPDASAGQTQGPTTAVPLKLKPEVGSEEGSVELRLLAGSSDQFQLSVGNTVILLDNGKYVVPNSETDQLQYTALKKHTPGEHVTLEATFFYGVDKKAITRDTLYITNTRCETISGTLTEFGLGIPLGTVPPVSSIPDTAGLCHYHVDSVAAAFLTDTTYAHGKYSLPPAFHNVDGGFQLDLERDAGTEVVQSAHLRNRNSRPVAVEYIDAGAFQAAIDSMNLFIADGAIDTGYVHVQLQQQKDIVLDTIHDLVLCLSDPRDPSYTGFRGSFTYDYKAKTITAHNLTIPLVKGFLSADSMMSFSNRSLLAGQRLGSWYDNTTIQGPMDELAGATFTLGNIKGELKAFNYALRVLEGKMTATGKIVVGVSIGKFSQAIQVPEGSIGKPKTYTRLMRTCYANVAVEYLPASMQLSAYADDCVLKDSIYLIGAKIQATGGSGDNINWKDPFRGRITLSGNLFLPKMAFWENGEIQGLELVVDSLALDTVKLKNASITFKQGFKTRKTTVALSDFLLDLTDSTNWKFRGKASMAISDTVFSRLSTAKSTTLSLGFRLEDPSYEFTPAIEIRKNQGVTTYALTYKSVAGDNGYWYVMAGAVNESPRFFGMVTPIGGITLNRVAFGERNSGSSSSLLFGLGLSYRPCASSVGGLCKGVPIGNTGVFFQELLLGGCASCAAMKSNSQVSMSNAQIDSLKVLQSGFAADISARFTDATGYVGGSIGYNGIFGSGDSVDCRAASILYHNTVTMDFVIPGMNKFYGNKTLLRGSLMSLDGRIGFGTGHGFCADGTVSFVAKDDPVRNMIPLPSRFSSMGLYNFDGSIQTKVRFLDDADSVKVSFKMGTGGSSNSAVGSTTKNYVLKLSDRNLTKISVADGSGLLWKRNKTLKTSEFGGNLTATLKGNYEFSSFPKGQRIPAQGVPKYCSDFVDPAYRSLRGMFISVALGFEGSTALSFNQKYASDSVLQRFMLGFDVGTKANFLATAVDRGEYVCTDFSGGVGFDGGFFGGMTYDRDAASNYSALCEQKLGAGSDDEKNGCVGMRGSLSIDIGGVFSFETPQWSAGIRF